MRYWSQEIHVSPDMILVRLPPSSMKLYIVPTEYTILAYVLKCSRVRRICFSLPGMSMGARQFIALHGAKLFLGQTVRSRQ